MGNENTITIAKKSIRKKGGVVILPLSEYRKLCEQTIPTYYLTGKEAEKLDKLVKGGLKDHKNNKTRKIKSLRDLD